MKIKVIGCGNAFSEKNFNQSFLIEENGRKLLIDCGSQIPRALQSHGIDFKEIDDIYISHLHADHIGGLEYFAFQRYDWVNKPRKANNGAINLIGNVQLLKDLWNKSLSGGLESMQGFVANINTWFHTQPVEPNESFEWQGWKVDLIQQIHVMSGSVIMPSFGMIFKKEGHKTVYFVTDSQHCSPRQVEDFYNEVDIIFQDSEFIGVNTLMEEGTEYFSRNDENVIKEGLPLEEVVAKFAEKGWEEKKWSRAVFGSGVHANYAQLAGYNSANSIKLSKETKSKMWLSHYQDFVNNNKDMFGNDIDWDKEIAKEGFAGKVTLGQEFEI